MRAGHVLAALAGETAGAGGADVGRVEARRAAVGAYYEQGDDGDGGEEDGDECASGSDGCKGRHLDRKQPGTNCGAIRREEEFDNHQN